MSKHLAVAGASNQIGAFLLPMLLADGWQVTAISRREKPNWIKGAASLDWQTLDLAGDRLPLSKVSDLIHLAPLHLFGPLVAVMPELRRVVVTSSTSRFTKIDSSDRGERSTARRLAIGEREVIETCQGRALTWSLLRPTLIYGAGFDRSLTRLAGLIERLHFLPLPGQGLGQRQPVHAEDLATAILKLLGNEARQNRDYELCGGETLAYREMATRIFESLGLKPRLVQLPMPLLRLGVSLLRLHPHYRDIGVEMLNRINEDLVFDCSKASGDFGYQPRGFAPRREDWIPLQDRSGSLGEPNTLGDWLEVVSVRGGPTDSKGVDGLTNLGCASGDHGTA